MSDERQRVLIVEEDRVEAGILAFHLRRTGLITLMVASEEEALDAVAWGTPHALITELRGKGANGLRLIRRLAGTPVVAILTAPGPLSVQEELEALELGVTAVYPKPVDAAQVAERIKGTQPRPLGTRDTGAPREGIGGDLAVRSTPELMALCQRLALSARLEVTSDEGRRATWWLLEGEVVGVDDLAACEQLATLGRGTFALHPLPDDAPELVALTAPPEPEPEPAARGLNVDEPTAPLFPDGRPSGRPKRAVAPGMPTKSRRLASHIGIPTLKSGGIESLRLPPLPDVEGGVAVSAAAQVPPRGVASRVETVTPAPSGAERPARKSRTVRPAIPPRPVELDREVARETRRRRSTFERMQQLRPPEGSPLKGRGEETTDPGAPRPVKPVPAAAPMARPTPVSRPAPVPSSEPGASEWAHEPTRRISAYRLPEEEPPARPAPAHLKQPTPTPVPRRPSAPKPPPEPQPVRRVTSEMDQQPRAEPPQPAEREPAPWPMVAQEDRQAEATPAPRVEPEEATRVSLAPQTMRAVQPAPERPVQAEPEPSPAEADDGPGPGGATLRGAPIKPLAPPEEHPRSLRPLAPPVVDELPPLTRLSGAAPEPKAPSRGGFPQWGVGLLLLVWLGLVAFVLIESTGSTEGTDPGALVGGDEPATEASPEEQREATYGKALMAKANKATPGEIESHLLEVLAGDPKHEGALTELATMAFRRQSYHEAARLFGELSKLRPTDPAPWLYVGASHLINQDYEDARKALARFVELAPEHPSNAQARSWLAVLDARKKK